MARLLIIDGAGLALDFAMRCQDAGHEVRWFIRRVERTKDIGRGILVGKSKLVDEWQSWMRWADVVFLSDNVKYLREVDAWRKRDGIKVVGACCESASWELDRNAGQALMKKEGLKIAPYREFSDYDSAIAYVKKEGRAFVSKPCGDEPDKSLTYVSKSPADLVYMLERWKKAKRHKGSFILQECVKGTEMAVGGWFGPGGFMPGWHENFEFKKLMAGDTGPATGEMGCYSEDTEVLTGEGWKYWPEVTEEDTLASLVDGETIFQKPSAVVSYSIDATMIGWKNQTLDILVTPNHNMLVEGQSSARKSLSDYRLVPAEDCTRAQYGLRRTAAWTGSPQGGRRGASEKAWAALLGAFMADGCKLNSGMFIAAQKPRKREAFQHLIEATGLPWKADARGFSVPGIREEVEQFGTATEKFVPAYIKDSTPEVISSFLDAYGEGDGNAQANGFRVFYTASRRLAGDVQELLLKLGRVGIVKAREPRVGSIDGREIRSENLQYEVIERVQKTRSWLDARDRYEVPYKGKVYCAEVKGHVLFVRRNGKPLWCGNTVVRSVDKSKLADKVLKPFTDMLHKVGYCGYIDVNCIIDDKGVPWPLEFTCRPGWPTFNIQMGMLKGDPLEWMLDLATGRVENAFKSNSIAVGVVMAIPDFPFSLFTRKDVTGIPVYGLSPSVKKRVHPCEMMQGEAPHNINGKVVTVPCLVSAGDYLLVASGLGETVRAARSAAYRVLDGLEVPNSPFWRPDIGERLRKQLPLIQTHGYATNLSF